MTGSIKTITRFEAVVKLFGGPKKFCAALGFGKSQSGQSIHIWRKDKQFPAKHYFSIQYQLLEKGFVASPTLFSFNDTGVPFWFVRYWIKTIPPHISRTWPKRRKEFLRVHKECSSEAEDLRRSVKSNG